MSQNKLIMIVEDNKDTLDVIDIYLNSVNYETIKINKDFSSILDKIKQTNPDLILMDIFLGECSGIELIKQIKNSEEHSNLPIIAVTALTDASSKKYIMKNADADAYIGKPFEREELIEIIDIFI